MSIQINDLTAEEINGLNLTISNGVVTQASISTLLPDNAEINLVCFGDSNTFGLNLQESEKFATLLNNNPDITAFNEGISGNTSANLLSRIQTSVFDRKDVNKRNILVLLIGTNDPGYNLTLQQSKDNIDSIISQSITEGWEVIYLTYPPSDALQYNDNLRAINTHISSNATGYSIIDINSLFITPTDWNVNRDELINSQLHFNGNGHIVISEAIQNFLGYDNFQVTPDELSTVNTALNGYEGVYYFNISNTKRILLSKLNNMFKIGIIDYTVATGGSPFGGNTSLSSKITNYWKMDATGTVTDSVPTTGVDSVSNSATFIASAKINGGMSYTTNDSTVFTDTDFDTSGDFSAGGWVKFDTFGSTADTIFMSKRGTGAANGWMLLSTTGGKLRMDYYNNSGTYFTPTASTTTFLTGTWYHIGFTYNNTSKLLQTYINGSAEGSVTVTGTPGLNNESFKLGMQGTSFFEGDLDEFFFANGSLLTATDFSDLYNGGTGLSY